MREKIQKILYATAGVLDSITIVACLLLASWYLKDGDVHNGLLSFIASGVWCISSTVYDINKKLSVGVRK